jgi:hypothetical protein
MGYTHYWEYSPEKIECTETLRRKFKAASGQIKRFAKFIERQDLFKIRGGSGEGKPVFNESEIWFNGDASADLDHETFSIRWHEKSRTNPCDWFCKTAHKPYDLLVCFALLTLVEKFGRSVFSFSSDGDSEDWKEVINLYETFTGKTAPWID